MLPLILLLGLGVALAAYEFSPRARVLFDDYARAIREAHTAHRTADAHLSNAKRATAIAAQHAQAAVVAHQAAPWTPPPPLSPIPSPTPVVSPPTVPPAPMPMPPAPTPMPIPAQDLADAHADAAQQAADVASDHVAVANEANQAAAENTAEAAKNAKTEAERIAAAQSAAKVLEREKKIAAALASLGIGQCGVRSFTRVTARVKEALLAKLHAEGMTVTGDNPWNIDTHQYGVRLRAVWDPKASALKLIVTMGKGTEVFGGLHHVTCEDIWDKIDPIMKGVIG